MDVLVGTGIGTSLGGRRCTQSKSFGADPEAEFGRIGTVGAVLPSQDFANAIRLPARNRFRLGRVPIRLKSCVGSRKRFSAIRLLLGLDFFCMALASDQSHAKVNQYLYDNGQCAALPFITRIFISCLVFCFFFSILFLLQTYEMNPRISMATSRFRL